MKKVFAVCSLIIGIFCGTTYAADDPVLAKLGTRQLKLSDLNRIITYYTPEQQQIIETTPDYKVKLLQRIVQEWILSDIAKKEGIDKRPDVVEQIELLINNQLTAELLKKEVLDKIKVTEEDARNYYLLHPDEFRTPEAVRARHILVKAERTDADNKKAREKAEEILKRIRKGEDFAKLASELSDDAGSKAKGGDLGFFQKGKVVAEFEKAAFGLKPGEVSGVVETKYGYHVIKTEEKKDAGAKSFDEVKAAITEKMLQDIRLNKIKEYLAIKLKEANAEVHPELLQKSAK